MTDPQRWVAPTYQALADLLSNRGEHTWDEPTLCTGWKVRHLVAHVAMPTRLTPEVWAEEMAAARGDFGVLSDKIASRDSSLPTEEHLASLRSPMLHAWQPPNGADGALSHCVIHSLDVTLAIDEPAVAPLPARIAVLDQLTAANGAHFGLDLSDIRLETTDAEWRWGTGEVVRASSGELVALLSARTLPDGRSLRPGSDAVKTTA